MNQAYDQRQNVCFIMWGLVIGFLKIDNNRIIEMAMFDGLIRSMMNDWMSVPSFGDWIL